MAKTEKRDWFLAALILLNQEGIGGLTIAALCRQLERTKGAFYHHFRHVADFKQQLLAHYEAESTLEIIQLTEMAPTPAAKLRRLLTIILETPEPSENIEVTIRAWALQDKDVRTLQEEIDQQRIAYVQQLCQEITGDPEQALLMSQMLYTILIGSGQLHPPLSRRQLGQLFTEFLHLYQIPRS